jgi:hypothetical protein
MPYSPDRKKGTRQRILKAAARLLNQKGFSEATIEGIMTAAGLTHGGFYGTSTPKTNSTPKLSGNSCKRTCPQAGRNRRLSCVIQTCRLQYMSSMPTYRATI